jgi:hypothetical protein
MLEPRPIKFQAFDGERLRSVHAVQWEGGEPSYAVVPQVEGEWGISRIDFLPPSQCRLLQFTGLLDCEGREVYEGHLLECARYLEGAESEEAKSYGIVPTTTGPFLVRWLNDEHCWGFDFPLKNDPINHIPLERLTGYADSVRIIGHVLTDPDLLTQP